MDVMTALAQIPGIGPVLPYLIALVGLCAALAAILPPPKVEGGLYARIYGVVNFIGVNIGHATNSTAPGQPASPTLPKAAIGLLFATCIVLSLAACTAAQQTAVETAVQKNAAKITTVCADVMLVANNPLTDVAAATVPVVGQVQAAVKAGCSTASGIASMAQSASTVDWLGTAKTVMQSGGKSLPAPVAPIPVSGS